jgi:acyl transferase domain-containing protein/NAD(P)H-dependent flavin oxidoreductase YrpB (nitropropane dioxygenase family)/NAD(P)-dependent dehydrogenase (short-subunit alcohol dehydrogenase family)/acyl carrier protein
MSTESDTRRTADASQYRIDAWSERPDAFPFLAITPFERPDLSLAQAFARHGTAVAVDVGRNGAHHAQILESLRPVCARAPNGAVGIRIPDHVAIAPHALFDEIGFVVLSAAAPLDPWLERCMTIVQVGSEAEARAALAAGAPALIARGEESGGPAGGSGAFILLQRILALPEARGVPVWCQGGMGLHSAAAAMVAGARGIVLDSQLALLRESTLPAQIKAAVQAMDGSEIRVLGGYHIYSRPGTAAAQHVECEPHEVRALLGTESLQDLLPIGQDAALAGAIAAQYPTVETLLQGLRTRIAGHLRQAKQLSPLAEASPLARAHRTRFAIAQGPMTRVSDTAGFAIAVAQSGALPFLALSLMPASTARSLLEQTRAGMGAHSWGVGVLGFAPPEILNPQLELIREFRPSVVLLAGGRPSQARPLVELGIPAYLHVPSPGLLELFLKDGARHFIFEGRECGGHVGPRYSFVLWEQQLQQLLACDRPEELHVYFAGGIHDARSAAMVAALAAPLAARGAKIGVMMGTAYLATEEAVRTGAIVAEFQRQVLSAVETTLIETAPGHAVRCLPSGFIETFTAEKHRLREQGIGAQQSWKSLEAFNVGRLRVASKGLKRCGDTLLRVDGETQQREGMYMLGQVAALCVEVTTMASLHRAVSADSTAMLQACLAPPLPRAALDQPIAIIGMECIFPGSPDVESYWGNILEGRDLITEVPAERWNSDVYYRQGSTTEKGKTPSKWGGFIDEIAFDPLQYGIPPQSLAAIEPVQLLSLEVAARALADAGYGVADAGAGERRFDGEKTSVIFGAEAGMELSNAYAFRNNFAQYCAELPSQLDAALPDLTEDSFPGVLANVIAGRIANRLDLKGVNYSVDAACASSLTAIELAVKELRSGSSDMVLAGGADFHNGINDFLMFASVQALSPSGRCRSFDAAADGVCLGEGIGVVVLKRLSDAERDGDRIYAVIDGIAGSSDGRGLGLTAPRKEGQKRALERAYWQAGQLPASVGLVEAHGTGTVVGDRTELKTLTEIYNAGGAVAGQAGLGSVKSQIGHTKCAAGIAGLIKVAKALYHRVLPPTQNIQAPTDWYRRANSPFAFHTTPRVWLDEHARAAVSAFGFGGTNFHALLSAHEASIGSDPPGLRQWPAELFAFRGRDGAEAHEEMRRLRQFLDQSTGPLALRDLAFTASGLGAGAVQCAFIADSAADLSARLGLALSGAAEPRIQRRSAASGGKVAFLFPGQGSQAPGMMQDIFIAFPQLRPILLRGRAWLDRLYPASAFGSEEEREQRRALTDTRVAQPALGIVEYALATLLQSCGVRPQLLAGHSYGELVALAVAKAFDLPTLLELSRRRGEAIVAAAGSDPGKMLAVSGTAAAIAAALRGIEGVVLANQNSPAQTVISGFSPAMDAALAALRQSGLAAKPIEVACAFHSPVLARAQPLYAEHLRDAGMSAPQLPVYSNTTTSLYGSDPAAIKAQLSRHLVEPVRFAEQIERMYADGARIFVEVGPGRVLTGFVDAILAGESHHTVVTAQKGRPGVAQFLEALAQLAVLTDDVDARALYAGRQARRLDLDRPYRLAPSTWMINGQRARPLQGPLPSHAGKALTQPVRLSETSMIPAQPHRADVPQERAVLDFLNNVREMVNAQRDVMLGFLGQATPAGVAPASPRSLGAAPALSAAAAAVPPMASRGAGLAHTSDVASAPDGALAPDRESAGLRETLLAIVSGRTGYPVEMLDLDLDLEADLSIDSIKRVEILGELSERLGFKDKLGAYTDALLEQLAGQKTLRAILEWLSQQLPEDTSAAVVFTPGATPPLSAAALPLGVGPLSSAAAANPEGAVIAPDIQALLLSVIGERTGYPPDALDLDLDLEADLSIDSIKRVEIVGEMLQKLGTAQTTADRDAALESMAALKTLRAVIDSLRATTRAREPAIVPCAEAQGTSAVPGTVARFQLRSLAIDMPAPRAAGLAGKKFLITDDGRGIARELAARIKLRGAEAHLLDFAADLPALGALEPVDGLIHLWSLHADHCDRDIARFYALLRTLLAHKMVHLVAASGLGGRYGHFHGDTPLDHHRGAGLAGLIKSVAKERPEMHARCVDLEPSETPLALAEYLELELLADDTLVEVAYRRQSRRLMEVVPVTLPRKNERHNVQLGQDSVVLLTGGARGITAALSRSLASQYRCRLELVARTCLETAADKPEYAAAHDPKSLRQHMLRDNPGLAPAAVERRCAHILAAREIRQTLDAIGEAGGRAHYTQLDVRDAHRFGEFIDDVYRRHGRLDGVVHGAGVVEDKLVRDKTVESFTRVFETKVRGAVTLSKMLRDDVSFVVFFSSVAGVFGNRGQADYAAANDLLDKLAHGLQARLQGRVLSVNWGPWAGKGMVSPELEREYARRGIGLIPLHEGVDLLLHELREGDRENVQIVMMCGTPERSRIPEPQSEHAGH